MLIKVHNDNTTQFPYTESQLRKDNPNVSFPSQVPSSVLSSYGVYPVSIKEKPEYDFTTHKLSRNQLPRLENGSWVLGWTLTSLSQDEIDEIYDRYKLEVEKEANIRVNAITGDSTSKLTNLMIAVDILDKRDQRQLTDTENATMSALRNVKDKVTQIRIAESSIKASIDGMTGPEIESLDIKNHPSWPS